MNLKDSLTALGATVLEAFRTRLELFGLELAEARLRLVKLLGMFFVAVFLLALAVLLFSLWFAMLFWQTEYRYVALGALAAVYALVGLYLLYRLRHDLVHGESPFAATLEELHRDTEMLKHLRSEVDAAGRALERQSQRGDRT